MALQNSPTRRAMGRLYYHQHSNGGDHRSGAIAVIDGVPLKWHHSTTKLEEETLDADPQRR